MLKNTLIPGIMIYFVYVHQVWYIPVLFYMPRVVVIQGINLVGALLRWLICRNFLRGACAGCCNFYFAHRNTFRRRKRNKLLRSPFFFSQCDIFTSIYRRDKKINEAPFFVLLDEFGGSRL